MVLKRPRGGLWLELKKSPAAERPIAVLKAPSRIYLPLRQHGGTAPELLVSKGERVAMGQPVAAASKGVCCPIHAPVSGSVLEIGEFNHPVGGKSSLLILENDGRDTLYQETAGRGSTVSQILSAAKTAGLVSAGGRGLPLWAELAALGAKKYGTVVLNAVETEPYICTSQKLLSEQPEDVAQGLTLFMKCVGAKKAVLAVSDDIPSSVSKGLVSSAHLAGLELSIAHIPQKYPSGNEQFLMRALFARELAAKERGGRGPSACFTYAQDCINLYRAAASGAPQLTRVITVAGDAVKNPQNLEVRLGTRIRDILDYCGLSFDPDRVVLGSAMRGVAVTSLDIPITKQVSAVLALKAARGAMLKSLCINCGKCASVCPQGLLPNYIAMRAVQADFEALRGLSIAECIECGSCAYICPGRMPIVELIKNIKKAAL